MTTKEDADYVKLLNETEQKSQSAYDNAILALSGGSFGISLAYLKDVVSGQSLVAAFSLAFAWGAWAASVSSILASFYFSALANRNAAKAYATDPKIFNFDTVGGLAARWNTWLTALAGILFGVGVIFMIFFVLKNTR